MEDYDGFLKSTKIQRTKILPLRWIGNYLGGVAADHLITAFDYDDHNDHGFIFRYHCLVYKYLSKPYEWWGTYYLVDTSGWSSDSESLDSEDGL